MKHVFVYSRDFNTLVHDLDKQHNYHMQKVI